MIQADTIKLAIKAENYKNATIFKNSKNTPKAEIVKGINLILPATFNKGIVMELTSNIFPTAKLLNKATITEALYRINGTGLIELTEDALETAYVCSADLTTDIQTDKNPDEYLTLLKSLYVGTNYYLKTYKHNKDMTFYYNNAKSGKYAVQFKMYNKSNEDKKNKFAKNTLRSELRLRSFKQLRHYSNAAYDNNGKILLTDFLTSKTNAVFNIFNSITKNIYENPIESMNNIETSIPDHNAIFMRSLTSKKEMEYFSMLFWANYDLNNLYNILKEKVKGHRSKNELLKPYAQVLRSWQLFDAGLTADYNLLTELRHKIQTPLLLELIEKTAVN